ncbi:MAG TPA: prolipoprotein diacylglyceryl transferase [Gaiellaceae bacterium]|nr:prolipoprotein diacylglyceryl transferase [Gaiellaceae bacterium]
MNGLLAYIPSPSSGTFHIGPLTLHMYGVMLLLGIAGCIWLTGRRWVRWGGDWDLVFRMALWGVIFGIIGARAYHDLTSWNQDSTIHAHWYGFAAVWDGGLGIWGAIPVGCLAGAVVVRRSGNSVRLMMDAVAPGLLLAQGIGRWGNYWNQELFGRPTSLPWALRIYQTHLGPIDPKYLPACFTNGTNPCYGYYHPTFLYEFIWDLLGVGVLLWIDRRFTLRRPALFALYVTWYTTFRSFEEVLRIDPSNYFLHMRINFWVSVVLWIASVAFFVWWQFIRDPSAAPTPKAKPIQIPKGPRMAVPKGRVR